MTGSSGIEEIVESAKILDEEKSHRGRTEPRMQGVKIGNALIQMESEYGNRPKQGDDKCGHVKASVNQFDHRLGLISQETECKNRVAGLVDHAQDHADWMEVEADQRVAPAESAQIVHDPEKNGKDHQKSDDLQDDEQQVELSPGLLPSSAGVIFLTGHGV